MTAELTHLVDEPGAKYSLCKVRDPMPRMWKVSAPAHKRPMARCRPCYEAAGLEWMLAICEGQGELW